MIDKRLRALEKLAFRYWLKNPERSAEENWKLAEKFLKKIDKRYKLKQK
jgi:hypothetical protein